MPESIGMQILRIRMVRKLLRATSMVKRWKALRKNCILGQGSALSRDKLTRKMAALVQMGYVQIQTARDGSIVTVSNWLENQTAGGMKIRLPCPENQYADGTEISTPCAENKSICGTKERAENGANAHFSICTSQAA